MTADQLRRELSARNLALAEQLTHEQTSGSVPCVIYDTLPDGTHGNFFPPSWRRIQGRPEWRRRLEKAYTASAHVARRHDRRRGELECATSSDALLMNIFCCPGVLRRASLCQLLGTRPSERARFGVRMGMELTRGHRDRTEIDLVLGDLLLEAKLTEGGFTSASVALVSRYVSLEDVFDTSTLARSSTGKLLSYQLLRGALAAYTHNARYALLCDDRRTDLVQQWFRVMQSVRRADLRSRLQLITWQEVAATLPRSLQHFLSRKYGITAAGATAS